MDKKKIFMWEIVLVVVGLCISFSLIIGDNGIITTILGIVFMSGCYFWDMLGENLNVKPPI